VRKQQRITLAFIFLSNEQGSNCKFCA